jgi:hypothetical protein
MIETFIINNNISFEKGNRNSSIVTLIGYSQHLNLNKEDLVSKLENQIKNDSFIEEEIDRIWNYCNSKNYKAFWSTNLAKSQYEF